MKIKLADELGFCYGVTRAVDIAENLAQQGEKVCTLGQLIHNAQMIEKLEEQGIITAETIEDIPADYHVVIRAHGVPKETLEKLAEGGYKVTVATCPYVANIHRIADKAIDEGKLVLILGDAAHPEIIGIVSHCKDRYKCLGSTKELEIFLKSDEYQPEVEYILVQQTTFPTEDFESCNEFIKNSYTNVDIFVTICKATMLRQKAAAELANKSDLMIVVGGYNSSNTQKLYNICSEHCKTILIETKDDLAKYDLSGFSNIGVTAGASTPAFIIKEVQNSMSDVVNNTEEMSFEEMLNESFKIVNARDRVTAIVTSVAPNEIAVDIGTKHAGYVPLYEYTDDPNVNLEDLVKPGDEIELVVLRVNDSEGTALLSKKRLDAIAGFEKIITAEEAGETLHGMVVDVVKGGIIVLTHGVRVFIPASQSSLQRGKDLETMRGEEVEYRILETNKNRRRAVGSIRALLQEERAKEAEAFWDTVEVGQEREGIVKSLTNYGAFIDLGGIDGMIHISELSWERIKHPSDILSIDEEVKVIVKDVDKENQKISLGYKLNENNPWAILEENYQAGDTATVKIVSLTPFGAFAQVIPGIDGLIHISQISHDRIEKPADVLSIGQEVEVKITEIDLERRRVSLSMRALLETEEDSEEEEARDTSKTQLIATASPEGTDVKVPMAEMAEENVEVKTEEVKVAVEEKAEEVKVALEEKVEEVKVAVEDKAEEVKEKAEEVEADIKEKAEDAKEKVKKATKDIKDKAEEVAEEVKDKIEDVADDVMDKVKEVAKEVKEKVKKIKEDLED